MKDILSLIDAEDEDIVEVIKEDSGEVITSGKWFEDNILQYSQTDSTAKEGYRFRICGRYTKLDMQKAEALDNYKAVRDKWMSDNTDENWRKLCDAERVCKYFGVLI